MTFYRQDLESYPLAILGSVPWFLAAGMLGPGPATILAALSGLIFGLWGIHNPFVIVELGIFATLLSVMLRQPYRTITFRLIRHPLVAGVILCLIYPLIFLIESFLTLEGLPIVRLEIAFSQLGCLLDCFHC
jgi:hypothetical protein